MPTRHSWENDTALEVDSEAVAIAGNSSNVQLYSHSDRLMMPSKQGRHLGRKKDLSAEGRAAAAAKANPNANAVAAAVAAVNVSPEKVTAVDKAQFGKGNNAKPLTAASKVGANVIHVAGSNVSFSLQGKVQSEIASWENRKPSGDVKAKFDENVNDTKPAAVEVANLKLMTTADAADATDAANTAGAKPVILAYAELASCFP